MSAGFHKKTLNNAAMVLGIVLLASFAGGCKKSSNDNTQNITARDGRASVAAVPQTQFNPQTGQSFQTATTYITTDANNSGAFQNALKNLVSANLDPQYLGNVSTTNGVLLRGYIELDQQGRVIPQTSRILIEIRDDLTGQSTSTGETVQPITMTLPATAGYAYNGQVQLQFQDSLGRIEIYGSYSDGGTFSGNVWFANTRKFDGSTVSNQLTGLGNFQVSTCGFLRCI